MSVSIAQYLADWSAGPAIEGLPETGRQLIKNAFLDTVAVTLLGSRQTAPRLLAELELSSGASGHASICGMGCKTDLRAAALLNGTSAHADLFDDNNAPMIAHPSSPLVSALLPLAQVRRVTGAKVMQAYGVGFETGVALGRALNPGLYEKGWHVTRVLGLIGATIACCRLLQLGSARTVAALGIAVSMASGVRQNFGTMTMALHVGLTARDALHAALLAEAGFGSDARALDGKYGMFSVFSDQSIALPALGEPFELLASGIIFKPYPSGAPTHAAVDAALAIRRRAGFDPERIVRIECLVHPWNAMTLRDELPADTLQAKVNMRYCIAAALLDGELTVRQFSPDRFATAPMLAMMRKIEIRISDHFQDSNEFPAELIIQTDDGKSWAERRDVPLGGSSRPLLQDDLAQKLRSCAQGILTSAEVDDATEQILMLDKLPSLNPLCEILEGQALSLEVAV